MTQLEAISLVEDSKSAKVLFKDDAKHWYIKLSKLIHPDVLPEKLRVRGAAAFAKLSSLYADKNPKPVDRKAVVIGKWRILDPVAKGDLCDVYLAESIKTPADKVIFKIVQQESDSDLVEKEYYVLKHMDTCEVAKSFHKNFSKYLPRIVDRMEASGRRANILAQAEGLSLTDISRFYPNKTLDFRHVVWFVNRALSVLGFAHKCGVVHGAVLPDHLLFGPESHSLILLDWCYSVTAESKKHIPAIVERYTSLYPVEVARKLAPTPATDIYMLFASLEDVAVPPRRFKRMFDWCLAPQPNARPSDAWSLQDRWLALAKEEYGDPAYLKLEIPKT